MVASNKDNRPFKCQPHKMVKQTGTTCWQNPTNYLNVFGHFVGLALKKLSFFLFWQKEAILRETETIYVL